MWQYFSNYVSGPTWHVMTQLLLGPTESPKKTWVMMDFTWPLFLHALSIFLALITGESSGTYTATLSGEISLQNVI